MAIDGPERDAIRILSLDSLVDEGYLDLSIPMIIKLDIEGVEIEAVRGASELLSRNAIIICEEHGSDRDHLVSGYLINETSLRVYIFDPAISRFRHVHELSVLDRIKRFAWVGYNVFATSSELWEERLQSAVWGQVNSRMRNFSVRGNRSGWFGTVSPFTGVPRFQAHV